MREKPIGLPISITVGNERTGDSRWIEPAERAHIQHKILLRATEFFGGATLVDTYGAWLDGTGKVVEERGFQVIVYAPCGDRGERVKKFVAFVLSVSRQASILVDDNDRDRAYLVSADSLDEDVTARG